MKMPGIGNAGLSLRSCLLCLMGMLLEKEYLFVNKELLVENL